MPARSHTRSRRKARRRKDVLILRHNGASSRAQLPTRRR
jgi:hypothetical protein